MRIFREGGTATPTAEERIVDVMQAAVMLDPVITRGFGAIFSCISMSEEVMAWPGFLERVIDCTDKVPSVPRSGPDREQLLELVS